MMNKKIGIIVFLICLCFQLMPFCGYAASTADAVEPIIPENECSLTVSYCYGETALSDVQVRLYRIAEVSADFMYTLAQPFEASELILNGIENSGEWNVIRSTLEAHILAYDIEPDAVSSTKEDGQVFFDALKTGLYLVMVDQVIQDDMHFLFDSALVSLPGLGQDGYWQYQTSVNAKGEALPPIDKDEEIEFKVLKLWKGDEAQTHRPKSVEVEIFRDGVSYEKVTLSEENNWSYSWSAKDDGSNWAVVERNVPQGYTVTVDERGNSFVLTNTWIPADPGNPGDPGTPPQTGDSSNIMLRVLLMTLSGTMMIILGVTGKRKSS